jgi:hypothetical protein
LHKNEALHTIRNLEEKIAEANGKIRRGIFGREAALEVIANSVLASRGKQDKAMIDFVSKILKERFVFWKMEYMALLGTTKEKDSVKDTPQFKALIANLSKEEKTLEQDFSEKNDLLTKGIVTGSSPLAQKIAKVNRTPRALAIRDLPGHIAVRVEDTLGDGDCAFRAIDPNSNFNDPRGDVRARMAQMLTTNLANQHVRDFIGAEIRYRANNHQLPAAVADLLNRHQQNDPAVVRAYIENFIAPAVDAYADANPGLDANYLEFPGAPTLDVTTANAIALILQRNLIVIDADGGGVLYNTGAPRNIPAPWTAATWPFDPTWQTLVVAQQGTNHVCRANFVN